MTRPFVLLYEPRHEAARLPLSLLHAASALDTGVVIVDGRLEMAPAAHVAELGKEALCLGVTVPTGAALKDALEVTRAAKGARGRLPVLWGGPHATYRPAECLATGVVDACVLGPGERTLAQIVGALRAGGTETGIAGMAFQRGEEVLRTLPRAAEDVNHLPGVDYGLLDLERHFRRRGARRVDVCSSRGDRSGGEWSGLLAERVVALVQDLVRRHHAEEVVFIDPRFFADAERVMAIAEGLLSAGLHVRWEASTSDLDLQHTRDRMDLVRLHESGARRITLWVEQLPSPALPDLAGALLAAGIEARVRFIVGRPAEAIDAPRQAYRAARALLALGPLVSVELRLFEPWPGSAEEEGLLGPEPPSSIMAWAAFVPEAWGLVGLKDRMRRRVMRWSFYLSRAAQHKERLGGRLVRGLARGRVRAGFYGLDLDRRAVLALRRMKAALTLRPPALIED